MIELLKAVAQSLLSAFEHGRACDNYLASVLLSIGIDVTDKASSANLQNMVRILEHEHEHEHEQPTNEECYSEIYGSSDSGVYSESVG
jgi:hypothetical protein